MRKLFVPVLFTFLALATACGEKASKGDETTKEGKPETMDERFSYFIGQDLAKNITRQREQIEEKGIKIEDEWVIQAFLDVMKTDTTILTQEELDQIMSDVQAHMQKAAEAKADSAKTLGASFLEENKSKEGVQVTPSGLQYVVVEEGTGAKPDKSQSVKVHYTGTLIDGTVFDSSIERGEPITFPVTGVIPGWTEALLMMKKGAKWKLFIPSELGYGERGAGQDIGPNEVLIFDVELIDVMDTPEQKQPQFQQGM